MNLRAKSPAMLRRPVVERVVASGKFMIHPGRLVDLAEHREILRLQVKVIVRAAEIETVPTQVAFRVLAVVTNPLCPSGLCLYCKRRRLFPSEPCDDVARSACSSLLPC